MIEKQKAMEENKQIFSSKVKFNNNLVVPIIVVVLLTTLAVLMVPDDGDEQEAKKPLPKLDSVVKPLEPSEPAMSPPGKPAAEKPAPVLSIPAAKDMSGGVISRQDEEPEQGARMMIAQMRKEKGNTGQKAFEAAEKQRSMGNTADAYLLYFFAAKQGHGEAAYNLGTQADPTYYTSVNSALDEPDPGQAIKWYQLAIDAGHKDARQNLKELAKRIKQQAETGSAEAERLLLQLQ